MCDIRISVGIACFTDDADEVAALVKTTDEPLYQAKTEGKSD
jgi:diguanylate cyclase (GGDEF)-like protein